MEDLFKKYKLKATSQRKLVFEITNNLGDDATVKNILLCCEGKVDFSTVYRIIELFQEKGIFEKKINYNNEIYYLLKEEHGHYINCIKCHKKEKIEKCPIDKIEENLKVNKGYIVLDHTIQINGVCSKCQDK